jgi:hypothetical protein
MDKMEFVQHAQDVLHTELRYEDMISGNTSYEEKCHKLEELCPFLREECKVDDDDDHIKAEADYWVELYLSYEEALNNALIAEDMYDINFGFSPFEDGCVGLYTGIFGE